MGHVGLKPWVYRFLSSQYPKAFPLDEVAHLAINGGIRGRGRDDVFNFTSTMRRWIRPGDAFQDARFGQRKDSSGRILIFALPEDAAGGDVDGPSSKIPTNEGLTAGDLAGLLVDQGMFAEAVDALKAIGNMSLKGRSLPQDLLREIESVNEQDTLLREKKTSLAARVMSYIQGAS